MPALIASMAQDHPDTVSQFRWMLQRLEVLGPAAVRWWCLYLAHGRAGMASRELADLVARKLGADAAATARRIERSLRRYLRRRGPKLDFFHSDLRQAVIEQYGPQAEAVTVHADLAAYFHEQDNFLETLEEQRDRARRLPPTPRPANRRKVEELVYQRIHVLRATPAATIEFHQACQLLEDLLTDLYFLEAKTEADLVYELARDFAEAAAALPAVRPRHRILRLLEEALRRDIQFIARHPTTLFQCLWNSCWWYDHPEASAHYVLPDKVTPHTLPPWEYRGPMLYRVLEHWRDAKALAIPGFRWLRSERPSGLPLGTGVRNILRHPMQEGVIRACFTPDGRLIVTAAWGEVIRIWDASTGEPLQCIRVADPTGPPDCINDFALSPDGKRIVTAANAVRVWETRSGREIFCLHDGPYVIPAVAYSRDGRFICSSHQNKILISDSDSGREIRRIEGLESAVESLAAYPDGRRLAGATKDGTVRVWDTDSGRELLRLSGHGKELQDVAVSNCGRLIASGSEDKMVRIWNTETGAGPHCLRGFDDRPMKGGGNVWGVTFSPDGKMVASAGRDRTVRVWDLATGIQIRCYHGHADGVCSVAFSSDGRYIISASRDDTARVWDISCDGAFYSLKGHEPDIFGYINCLASSPDGTRIVTGSYDHSVRTWDAQKATAHLCLQGHKASPNKVVVAEGAARIFSVDADCRLMGWNAETGDLILEIERCGLGRHAVSPDGRWVAGWSWNRPRRSGEETVPHRHEHDVHWIAGGYSDVPPTHTIRIWSALDGREHRCFFGRTDAIHIVVWSPDGQELASVSPDGVRVWDIGSRRKPLHFRGDLDISAMAYSPDGRNIVIGSRDWTVRVWATDDGRELRCLEGHDSSVDAVAYSPDGSRIASSDWNETRLWDAQTGRCLEVIEGTVDVADLARGGEGVHCRTVFNDPQTIFDHAPTGICVGWFPVPLRRIKWLGPGSRWAASSANHLFLVRLEGDYSVSSDEGPLSGASRDTEQ